MLIHVQTNKNTHWVKPKCYVPKPEEALTTSVLLFHGYFLSSSLCFNSVYAVCVFLIWLVVCKCEHIQSGPELLEQ